MSVVIYKDGVRELCEPHELTYQLGAGWSLTDGPEEVEEVIETSDEVVEITEEPVEPTDEEIRAVAKELGISKWHIKGIDRLKLEIEDSVDGDQD